jgi:hypothetical protein
MIFSVQRYIEDYFERRQLEDLDQYAVRLANLYGQRRSRCSRDEFLQQMRRVRTTFYRNNRAIDREEFDGRLLRALDQKFASKKNSRNPWFDEFPGGVAQERQRLRRERRTIGGLLTGYKGAVQARAVDAFWRSRREGRLRRRPETIAQSLLAVFVKGVLGDRGIVLRELASGVGFVDVGVLFGQTMHLVEIKVLTGRLTGDLQLATYMGTEGRSRGWLVLMDARRQDRRPALPSTIDVDEGLITVVRVDLNPVAPSKRTQRE